MLEIIEKFTLSKTYTQETSEDAYFINENSIVVEIKITQITYNYKSQT